MSKNLTALNRYGKSTDPAECCGMNATTLACVTQSFTNPHSLALRQRLDSATDYLARHGRADHVGADAKGTSTHC